MKLLHYSAKPFQFDSNRKYPADDHWKPSGLWLSVEGDNDWQEWCEEEGFALDNLKCVVEVRIKPDANVLLIDTVTKLGAFHARFCRAENDFLAWNKVKAVYDGLIIVPYQWERRLTIMWYYGWDCASGVIWNLSAIANVTRSFPVERRGENVKLISNVDVTCGV